MPKVNFTEAQVEDIILVTTDDQPLAGLDRAWFYILGKSITEFPKGSVKSGEYKMDRSQYTKILEASSRKLNAENRQTLNLYWVEFGPAVIS